MRKIAKDSCPSQRSISAWRLDFGICDYLSHFAQFREGNATQGQPENKNFSSQNLQYLYDDQREILKG